MKKTWIILLICELVVGFVRGEAEETGEIVVSASRIPSRVDSVGSCVTVVTAKDIQDSQSVTALDVLKHVPGVNVTQNGGIGTLATVVLRGATGDQTLVLVDGVELNDPVAPGRGAQLSNLDVAQIERIEILRGNQSGMYGSDAIGGVISITTKKGSGPPSGSLNVEGGSFNTYRAGAQVQGGDEKSDYSFGVSYLVSDGISAADEDDGNTEEDGFEAWSIVGRVGTRPYDNVYLSLIARMIDSENDFDAGSGPGGDSEGNVAERQTVLVRAQGDVDLMDSAWRQSLSLSLANHDRSSKSAWGVTDFESQLYKANWVNNIYLSEDNVISAGLEVESEEGKTSSMSREKAGTLGIYAENRADYLDNVTMTLSVRDDSHSDFGDAATYRAAAVWRVMGGGTRLKATYGTGFKAPSIYQLYAPAASYGPIGNDGLDPEKSTGWDAGIERDMLNGRMIIGATYFYTDVDDLIEFSDGYVNLSGARIKGVEFACRGMVVDGVAVNAAYTYTEAENSDTGEDLIRRPRDRASLGIDWDVTDAVAVGLDALYVGGRDDRLYGASMFGGQDLEMPSYTVVDLRCSYAVADKVTVFGRVENIFDENYQEIAGYGTPGISAYGGIRMGL